MTIFIKKTKVFTWSAEICSARQNATFHNRMLHQTVDKAPSCEGAFLVS